MLDILARVAPRPNPNVSLGSVDVTASFVVVNTTKANHPIVHLSPGFTHLTDYTEADNPRAQLPLPPDTRGMDMTRINLITAFPNAPSTLIPLLITKR